jgi:hypothetical protein
VVTVALNWWLLRPRPDLRLVHSAASVEDTERIARQNQGDYTGVDWLPAMWARLTNHGDGTAHDVRLTGERCRPRVWIGDSGVLSSSGQLVEAKYPLWVDSIAAIEPGASVNVCIVARNDPSVPKPIVTASWPRLPARVWAGFRSVSLDFTTQREFEYGLPGQKELGKG